MSVNFNPQGRKSINRPTEGGTVATSEWAEPLSFLKSIAIFFAIALMLRASVVEAFKIPSSSMEPTLEIGDQILVNKLSYGFRLPLVSETIFDFRKPERGDVIVFTNPDDPRTLDIDESDINIIKRVIGLPGDVLSVKGTVVTINGKPLKEVYARWLLGGKKDFKTVTVPEGHVFMMGDNRDYSRDSRFWTSPWLALNRVKGRAFIIYYNSVFSFDRMFNIIR